MVNKYEQLPSLRGKYAIQLTLGRELLYNYISVSDQHEIQKEKNKQEN